MFTLKIWSTVTVWKSKTQVMSYEFKPTRYEFQFTICKFESTSYEFKDTS